MTIPAAVIESIKRVGLKYVAWAATRSQPGHCPQAELRAIRDGLEDGYRLGLLKLEDFETAELLPMPRAYFLLAVRFHGRTDGAIERELAEWWKRGDEPPVFTGNEGS